MATATQRGSVGLPCHVVNLSRSTLGNWTAHVPYGNIFLSPTVTDCVLIRRMIGQYDEAR